MMHDVMHYRTFCLEPLEPRCLLSADTFAVHLYEDVLGRSGAPHEVQAWAAVVQAGARREAVVDKFLYSAEYAQNLVTVLYEDLLERAPDPAGLNYWVQLLSAGVREERLVASILATPEYYALQGATDAAFVSAVYDNLLGRGADAAGLAYWQGMLAAGVSRFDMALSYTTSDEFVLLLLDEPQARFDAVDGWFQAYLGRDADAGTRDYFLAKFQAGASWRTIQREILASDEYFAAL